MVEAAPRRTQAERTAATKEKLLDATVECLVELGYAGTTTTEVAGRAGVSRGAQVHHFPTKNELVVGALEHVLGRRQQEFRLAFAAVPVAERTLQSAVDLLWSMYRGSAFAAWLELAVAARTDPELRPSFLEVERRFTDQVSVIFLEFFPQAPDAPFSRVAVQFAFAVLDGLGMQRALGIGAEADEILELLKGLAVMFAPQVGGDQ